MKDSKGNLVSGLTWRDFTVYENNTREPLRVFSVDPSPLSVAFVIDQTLPSNVMDEVNQSMGAIQGALTPYDEAAVFTYTNGAKEWTGFTGGAGRPPARRAFAWRKPPAPIPPVPDNRRDPFAGCDISRTETASDPNLQPGGQHRQRAPSSPSPRKFTLSTTPSSPRPRNFPRVPRSAGASSTSSLTARSMAARPRWKEVVQYLANQQDRRLCHAGGRLRALGRGVGSTASICPSPMYDNILYKYTVATGGDMYAEGGVNGIEKSYAKIADEARNQYTLGYLSHESIYDGKYRNVSKCASTGPT